MVVPYSEAPSARMEHVAFFIDSTLFVYGGYDGNRILSGTLDI